MLAGLRRREVVLLEPPDLSGEVGGQQVELDRPLGHDVPGHLAPALVARGVGLGGQRLETGTLLGHDLGELLGDLVEGAPELAAVELLLALRRRRRSISSRSPCTRSPSLRSNPEVSSRRRAASGSPW